jgi:CBS domain-containing protein
MDILANQVMRRPVETVAPSLPLPDLERLFVQSGVSGFPVVEGDQVVGVVSRTDIIRKSDLERQTAQRTSDYYLDAKGDFHEVPLNTDEDVAERVGQRMEELTVADVMHPHIVAVRPDQPLRQIAEMMLEHDIHRVLVALEGRLMGVVSTSDFVRLYAQGRIKAAEH